MIGKAGRAAAYALLFVLGVAVGGMGSFLQEAYPPFGVVVAVGGAAGLFMGGGALLKAKAGALLPGAGWLVTVFYLASTTRPEGDFVFASGITAYVYLLGGTVVGVMAGTWPWGASAPVILPSESAKSDRG